MKHLDLFSGIGGFSLALESCGFKTVAFSEIDNFACRVLAHHWPDVPNLGDITKIDGNQVREQYGDIGVVTFGSPCQDLSVAGKRAGLLGARSSLFHEAIRIIRDLRPTFAIWENVAGAFSSAKGWDFASVLDSLALCGALDIGWRVLDAQFAGVPQRRDRIFVVADFRARRVGEILSLTESMRGNIAPRKAQRKDVAATLGGGAGARGWCDDTDRMTFVPAVAWALQERDAKGADSDTKEGHPIVTHSLRAEGFDASEDGTGRGTPIIPIQSVQSVRDNKQNGIGIGKEGDPMFTMTGRDRHAIAGTLRSNYQRDQGQTDGTPPFVLFDYKQSGETDPTMRALSHDRSHANGGSHIAVTLPLTSRVDRGGAHREAEGNNLIATFDERNITSKTNRSRVENGLPSHSLHADPPHLIGAGIRRLTPTECERLMGFPDGWTALLKAADGPRYRALGNAVVPCVVRQIAERMQLVG